MPSHDVPMISPPLYGGPGWIMWPDHPEPSLQFLRTLGAAQDGASTISECFLTAGRIDPGNRESWHREWQRIGDINVQRADAALAGGNRSTAGANYLRAGGYYRASEIYLAPTDARRVETFAKVASSSRSCLGLTSPAGQAVSIDVGDGTSLDGYLLKPEHGPQRSPAVICFGGLDGSKDELLPGIARHLRSRGFAVLLVDMPGQGEALRVRGMAIRPDSETPIARCVDFLLDIPDIDGDRIGIYGASLGGVYSARAAAFERRIKVAVCRTAWCSTFTPACSIGWRRPIHRGGIFCNGRSGARPPRKSSKRAGSFAWQTSWAICDVPTSSFRANTIFWDCKPPSTPLNLPA